MKKKILALALTLVMAAGALASCGGGMPYDGVNIENSVTVGEYKGMKAKPYKINVTDKEINENISQKLKQASRAEEVDSPVKKGDTVNIDYVGKKDGKEFEGGSAKGYDLEIGSGSFIPGFEEGLIGKKKGETVDLELTFPEDYQAKDMAGADVVFTVKINSVSRTTIPEYNLDFVKETTEYGSLEEYRKAVEKEIYNTKEQQAINKQKTDMWSQVLDNSEVNDEPDKDFTEQVETYMEFNSQYVDSMAEQSGMTREQALGQYYQVNTEEEFEKMNREASELRVEQEMIIIHIAKTEGLENTDEEAEKMMQQMKDQGLDEEAIEKETGRSAEEYIYIELLYEKVLDFILENGEIDGKADIY